LSSDRICLTRTFTETTSTDTKGRKGPSTPFTCCLLHCRMLHVSVCRRHVSVSFYVSHVRSTCRSQHVGSVSTLRRLIELFFDDKLALATCRKKVNMFNFWRQVEHVRYMLLQYGRSVKNVKRSFIFIVSIARYQPAD
jgi:hypothetical protein